MAASSAELPPLPLARFSVEQYHRRISEYWIVNLVDARVEVYTGPSKTADRGYTTCTLLRADDEAVLTVDEAERGRVPVTTIQP